MSFLSRRGFLHSSMGVAAGSALASTALAQDVVIKVKAPQGAATDRSTATAKAAPSERLRVAVIGCGGRGESHVDAFSGMKDVELVALCDPDGARVGQYAYKVER